MRGGRDIRDDYPFVDNQIDPALLSPAAKAIVARMPTTSDPCGRVDFSDLNNQDEHQAVGRVDYQQNDSHSMFFRYSIHNLGQSSDYDGVTALNVTDASWSRQYQSGVFGDTWSINNNLINSFRVTAFRTANTKTFVDTFSPLDVGITNITYPESYPAMMLVQVPGAFSLIRNFATPSFTNSAAGEISNDLNWVRGNHQFAFGGSYMRQLMYVSAGTSAPGEWRFRSRGTGLSMADFMIGYIDQFRQEPLSTWYPRQDFMSLYAQDTWRVNNQFTLNLGIRWEPFTPQVRTDKRHGRFQRDWFDQGIQSTVFENAPKGFLYSGGDRPEGVAGDAMMPDVARLSDNQWGHFAPRVGMSWDVSGDGRTSIRAAYGIFFDYPHVYQFNGVRNTPPYDPRVVRRRFIGGLDDPWVGFPGGDPFPLEATQDVNFPRSVQFAILDSDFKAPYVHQYNVSIQRQIGREWMATANYMGNSTIHLLNVRDANPIIDGVRELTRADPTSPYAALNKFDPSGTANYNALWLSLERQSASMNSRMNYTLSHCIDDGTVFNSGSAGKPSIHRRAPYRGNCDLDRRHLFNLTNVYETPEFANPTLRVLAGGWRVSGIMKFESGPYFSIECGCDSSNADERIQYAQQLMPNVFTSDKSADQYLNPAAFADPADGTYGNMGRNNVQGPGFFRLDMGLTRQFAIAENQTLEFRAEVFNLPNWVNLNIPDDDFSNRTFGRVTSARDPRIMQFALKYVF